MITIKFNIDKRKKITKEGLLKAISSLQPDDTSIKKRIVRIDEMMVTLSELLSNDKLLNFNEQQHKEVDDILNEIIRLSKEL